jgi:dephospho-CoA kinase
MAKLGLTGNLMSGHVEVAKNFTLLEFPVFDADIALKFILNYREDIRREIKIQFGNGILDKGIIESHKFNSVDKFDRLIDIAEPELLKLYEDFQFVNRNKPFTIFKYSILFERKLQDKFDYIATVFKPKDDRASEISKTCQIGMTKAYDIVESEFDELSRNQRANFVIHNYDNLSLLTQTKSICDRIQTKIVTKLIDYNTVKNVFS